MLRADLTAAVCWLGVATVALACSSGCHTSGAGREQLVSPYPLDRVQAAVQLAEAGDAQAVDQLIVLLEDRDRGVRMYAILALERLCGETYEYRYYDPEPLRAAAIARWREARRGGEVRLQNRTRQPNEKNVSAATGGNANDEQSP
jgi:HEAT repeat protein